MNDAEERLGYLVQALRDGIIEIDQFMDELLDNGWSFSEINQVLEQEGFIE